jgi:hypothetical protein
MRQSHTGEWQSEADVQESQRRAVEQAKAEGRRPIPERPLPLSSAEEQRLNKETQRGKR